MNNIKTIDAYSLTINNSLFDSNIAGWKAGALMFKDSYRQSMSILRNLNEERTLQSTSLSNSYILIDFSNITNNRAKIGGALLFEGIVPYVSDFVIMEANLASFFGKDVFSYPN